MERGNNSHICESNNFFLILSFPFFFLIHRGLWVICKLKVFGYNFLQLLSYVETQSITQKKYIAAVIEVGEDLG